MPLLRYKTLVPVFFLGTMISSRLRRWRKDSSLSTNDARMHARRTAGFYLSSEEPAGQRWKQNDA